MDGSRTIRVIKADKNTERFDQDKLAGAIWRAMCRVSAPVSYAGGIAEAVEIYLRRSKCKCISTAAIFEMVLQAFTHVALSEAAETAEDYQDRRRAFRSNFRILHDGGKATFWDKAWLSELACRSWYLSRQTGRFLAGQIEQKLMARGELLLSRQTLVDELNQLVAAYGLADAVPMQPGLSK